MRNDVFLKSAKKSPCDARCSPSLLSLRLISFILQSSPFSCSMPNHGISPLEYRSHFQKANSGGKSWRYGAVLLHSSAALVCDDVHRLHPLLCGQKFHWEAQVLAFSGYIFHLIILVCRILSLCPEDRMVPGLRVIASVLPSSRKTALLVCWEP